MTCKLITEAFLSQLQNLLQLNLFSPIQWKFSKNYLLVWITTKYKCKANDLVKTHIRVTVLNANSDCSVMGCSLSGK